MHLQRLVVLLGATAVLLAGGAGAAPPGTRTITFTEGILGLSADGGLVAVNRYLFPCDGISIWDPASGRSTLVRRSDACENGEPDTKLGALAGQRLLWRDVTAGNTLYDVEVLTTSALGTKPVELAELESHHDGVDYGPQVGGFAGDGDLLVYAAWTQAKDGTVTVARLYRVDGTRQRIIHRFSSRIVSISVDAGRIAVAEPAKVSLLDRTGKLLRTITPGLPSVDAVALQGRELTIAGGRTLLVHDSSSGRRLSTITLLAGSRLADLASGVAVIVQGNAVRALRLADRHAIVVERTNAELGGWDVSAQIEPAGLTYGYTIKGNKGGVVVFVPWQQLLRLLGPRR